MSHPGKPPRPPTASVCVAVPAVTAADPQLDRMLNQARSRSFGAALTHLILGIMMLPFAWIGYGAIAALAILMIVFGIIGVVHFRSLCALRRSACCCLPLNAVRLLHTCLVVTTIFAVLAIVCSIVQLVAHSQNEGEKYANIAGVVLAFGSTVMLIVGIRFVCRLKTLCCEDDEMVCGPHPACDEKQSHRRQCPIAATFTPASMQPSPRTYTFSPPVYASHYVPGYEHGYPAAIAPSPYGPSAVVGTPTTALPRGSASGRWDRDGDARATPLGGPNAPASQLPPRHNPHYPSPMAPLTHQGGAHSSFDASTYQHSGVVVVAADSTAPLTPQRPSSATHSVKSTHSSSVHDVPTVKHGKPPSCDDV